MPLDNIAHDRHPPALRRDNPTSLAEAARVKMEKVFAGGEHHPSENQWTAIMDYLQHAEAAARGALPPAVYLSAIPAGTGKSVAVAAIAAALAETAAYEGVGVLIAVNRIAEAEAMAEALREHRSRLCLVVGRKHATAMESLGDHKQADPAQLVITTQAALKETLRRDREFDAATRYFYRGERRRLVLWDEAIAFNRPVVLDSDAVVKLTGALRRQSPEAVSVLLRWAAELGGHSPGPCRVPDFRELGIDVATLEMDADSDDLSAQARALSIISGETGHILVSNARAAALVTYIPELPRSLMPVLVTDASAARGVHHAGYDMMAQTLPVERLKEAVKTYRNLTVRIVPAAASRSTYRKRDSYEGRDLIEMIVAYVRRVAPEPVLLVAYKARMVIRGVLETTIAEAVRARLTDAEWARVSVLTWGSHTATNDHKGIGRVIFCGLYFMPREAAYATAGAALGKPMNTTDDHDHPSPKEVKDMGDGLLRDSTLQAVLRGRARMGVNGDCGVQEVVIPQAPQTGLSTADLEAMFPGCAVVRDVTLMPLKPLKGRLKKMADEVQRRQEAGDHVLTDSSIYTPLGIGRADYSKLKKREEWGAHLLSQGWHQAKLSGGLMGLRRAV